MKYISRRRWIIWTPLALAFLTAYFHRTATGVIADSLMRDFSIARASELGILSSIYFYVYAAMQPPAGILADYYGPRRTVTMGLMAAAAGAVLFGSADNLAVLYAGRILVTVGVGVIYVSIVKIYAEWFRLREFGTMSGVIVVVANVGSVLSATPLAIAVEALGWRAAFYMIAGYTVVMAAVCWLLVRDRPSDMGLPAMMEIEIREGLTTQQFAAGQDGIAASVRKVLQNQYTWWPFLASASVYGVYMSFMGIWGVPYFMQIYGISRVAAANYVMVMAAGNAIGGQLIGILSDRVGLRSRPYTYITAFFLLMWLVLTLWGGAKPPEWALYPLCLGIGIGMSGITLGIACTKEVNPPQAAGVAAGVANAAPFVGAALMQPAFGWVLDLQWQGDIVQGVRVYPIEAYQTAFGFCTAVLVLGLLFTLKIKETRCGNTAV
jgi:sugar phosphate permease